MGGRQIQDLLPLRDAPAPFERMPENGLRRGVVPSGIEVETFVQHRVGPTAEEVFHLRQRCLRQGIKQGAGLPAGEGAGGLLDVLLRVATVHPESVEFEEFPGVVLVDARLLHELFELAGVDAHAAAGHAATHSLATHSTAGRAPLISSPQPTSAEPATAHPSAAPARARPLVPFGAGSELRGQGALVHPRGEGLDALRGVGAVVVQVDQHGGVFGRGTEEGAEIAEDVGADGVPLVAQYLRRAVVDAGDGDVEVVEPEVGQDFGQLGFGVEGAVQLLGHELVHQVLHGFEAEEAAEGLEAGPARGVVFRGEGFHA